MSLKDFTDYACERQIFFLFAVHMLGGCDSLETFMNCVFTLGYVKIFWGWVLDKACIIMTWSAQEKSEIIKWVVLTRCFLLMFLWVQGLWPTEKKGVQDGSNNNGKSDPPRNSNASKHERPTEIHIVTVALGFVSSFEDVYRLWSFIAKFLDADFVSRETRFYHSLNQETVVL